MDVRKRIAYVFQYGALFDSLTVEENLAYPLREHTSMTSVQIHDKVLATLGKIGLEGSEKLMPADLSGGMQRRVGVARAIILEPEVILYDEPTTGLDPYNLKQILKIMVQLQKQGATSVLVTHDMSSIFAVTDRVAFLKDGVIEAVGTADEIKNTKRRGPSEFHLRRDAVMDKKIANNIIVGIFTIVGVTAFIYVLFTIGGGKGIFSSDYTLYAKFDHVKGLNYGSEVSLAGLRAGTVKKISVEATDHKNLVVEMLIDKDMRDKIRQDSEATILTSGVLGDKYIEISIGSPNAPPLQSGRRPLSPASRPIFSPRAAR